MHKIKSPNLCVVEDVKIAINLAIEKFAENQNQTEFEFPSSLTSNERKYIHNYAGQLGYKTKSRGKGFNRFLTIYKKDDSTIISNDASFKLGRTSQTHIISLMSRYPLNERERKELLPVERDKNIITESEKELNCTTGKLSSIIPQVPPRNHYQDEFYKFRKSLPIWSFQKEIVENIASNSVVLITGETGCGKTTQVPQFILEHCSSNNIPCRIICAEPRRIAALNVSERVSTERGELIGQTVGYQIRLESKVSPRTLLTFCTNGILLRTLMGGDNTLNTVTHVIIDEIHERDRYSDFLLLKMKDVIKQSKNNIKLILMSATFDIESFVHYFDGCPVVNVPGNCFDVKSYFLEDVLKMTNYMTPAMNNYKKYLENKDSKQKKLSKWCEQMKFMEGASSKDNDDGEGDCEYYASFSNHSEPFVNECNELDDDLKAKIDLAIENAWTLGTDSSFEQLIDLMISEHITPDYQHSETGVTALIAATCHAKLDVIESLLNYGANVSLKTPNDWDALEWAKYFGHTEVTELLQAFICCNEKRSLGINSDKYKVSTKLTEEEKKLLDIYHYSFDDDDVDIELICFLLEKICNSELESGISYKGAILVFLPGYDDIVRLRELLINNRKKFDDNKYVLYTLHSQMQSSDQKRIFKKTAHDVRKIILSTNIAETSITIDDVVYVIDSGKVKEKAYDATAGISSLKSVWISQSSAIQRRGRAGRCRSGICFHLFSKTRFANMQVHQMPEMQRMPIHELCLQAKLLAPNNVSILDFLSKAPDPPSSNAINNAIYLLKKIDALDCWERLTELGLHLLDLPIEPNLGKIILYSVILKCLDPILTIVCALAYRDPFVIPTNQSSRKRSAAIVKRKLSGESYSDHMILLRTFQAWQKARSDNYERSFCEQNFVSSAVMEMIVGMRAQLLGQLRASGFVRARGAGDIRDLNTNSENWAVVKAALCAGTYPNLMRVDLDRKQMITQKHVKVRFHPSSVLNSDPTNPKENIFKNRSKYLKNLPSDWFIFEEMTRIGKVSYARCCSLINPITVVIFAGPSRLPVDCLVDNEVEVDSDSEKEDKIERCKTIFKIDDWITFKVDPELARFALNLRQKWHSLFLRRMTCPSKPLTAADEVAIKTVVEVLSAEEHALKLKQPTGIGQRPRPMSTDFCPPFSNVSNASPINRSHFSNNRSHFSNNRSNRSSPRQQMYFHSPRNSHY